VGECHLPLRTWDRPEINHVPVGVFNGTVPISPIAVGRLLQHANPPRLQFGDRRIGVVHVEGHLYSLFSFTAALARVKEELNPARVENDAPIAVVDYREPRRSP
jgi:hypothetical protein